MWSARPGRPKVSAIAIDTDTGRSAGSRARARSDVSFVSSFSRPAIIVRSSPHRARSSRIFRKSKPVTRVLLSKAAARSCSKTSGGRFESRIAASTAGSVSSAFAASRSNAGADSSARIRRAASRSSAIVTVSPATGGLS